MTDKELHRLSRRELLQLLLTQAKDTEELRHLAEEREEQLESLRENYERLKKRLDHKDAQIHDLRLALHEERTNRRIELEEAGSIAEAALRLNGIFEMAQKAAEQYLYNIRLLHEKEEAYAAGIAEQEAPEETEYPGKDLRDSLTEEEELPDQKESIQEEYPSEQDESILEPDAEEPIPESDASWEDAVELSTENPEDNTAEPEAKVQEEDGQEPEAKGHKGWRRGRKKRTKHKE